MFILLRDKTFYGENIYSSLIIFFQAQNNNGEYATRSLPRVRIDGGNNIGNGVRLRCWAAPPSITEEEVEDEIEEDAVSLRALPSQG